MTVREKEDQALLRLESMKLRTLEELSRFRSFDDGYEQLVQRATRFERAMGRIVMKGTKKS